MQPLFGSPLVYVLIPEGSTDLNQLPAELYAATSLGNVQAATAEGQAIDMLVMGLGPMAVLRLDQVPAFQAGQQHSGWRYYTPHELTERGISGWPSKPE